MELIPDKKTFYAAAMALLIALFIPSLSYYLSYTDNIDKLKKDRDISKEKYSMEISRQIKVLNTYSKLIALEANETNKRQLQKEKELFFHSHTPLRDFETERIENDLNEEIEHKTRVMYPFMLTISCITMALIWCLYRLSGRDPITVIDFLTLLSSVIGALLWSGRKLRLKLKAMKHSHPERR